MKKGKKSRVIFLMLSVLIILCMSFFPFEVLFLEDNIIITKSQFENLLKSGNIVLDTDVTSCSQITENEKKEIESYAIKYKLFNIFNIKNLKVDVVDDKVFLGGKTLGFNVNTKGVIIVGSNYVITENGKVNPILSTGLKVGDVIIKINGVEIITVEDIVNILKVYTGESPLLLNYIREGFEYSCLITPALDIQSKSYKLGLWLKEDAMGIGTLTYVDTDSNFGALGHAISLDSSGHPLDIVSGKIYNCNVVGVKVGSRGQAGQLLGVFNVGDNTIGDLNKNCAVGAFGKVSDIVKYSSDMKKIEVGGKSTAKPGKAKILSCIDGKNVEEYDIEIIKTNYKGSNDSKSMIIRIIDNRLLNKTGGIVQGMSGSPIIQNNKLIGAVTHVFLNDATKGFGLYIDYMMEEQTA